MGLRVRGSSVGAHERPQNPLCQAILSQEAYGVLPLHSNRIDCCLLRWERTEFVLTDHDASFAFASSDGDAELCRGGARIAVTQQ